MGVLIRGHAALVRYDYAGTRTILEQIGTGGVFGGKQAAQNIEKIFLRVADATSFSRFL